MINPSSSDIFATAENLLRRNEPAICVEITDAKGSTPRDAGCVMLVTGSQQYETIGGGQLEWIALKRAREMLSAGTALHEETISLGPNINQCCGGVVSLKYSILDPAILSKIRAKKSVQLPAIQIHGAGHTGTALAKTLDLLPFDVSLVDTRSDLLSGHPAGIKTIHSALPEREVNSANQGTAFVIFTHSHFVDFLIAAEALKRRDAAYVGMIGSKTKRAVFANWLSENDYSPDLTEGLTCPIGGAKAKDKRPEIIAALVSAELINVFAAVEA